MRLGLASVVTRLSPKLRARLEKACSSLAGHAQKLRGRLQRSSSTSNFSTAVRRTQNALVRRQADQPRVGTASRSYMPVTVSNTSKIRSLLLATFCRQMVSALAFSKASTPVSKNSQCVSASPSCVLTSSVVSGSGRSVAKAARKSVRAAFRSASTGLDSLHSRNKKT